MRLALILAVILLGAAPAAATAPESEPIEVSGTWSLTAQIVDGVPLGLFIDESGSVALLRIEAESLTLETYTRRSTEGIVVDVAPPPAREEAQYAAAVMDLAANTGAGWLGAFPESATLEIASATGLTGSAASPGMIGNGVEATARPDPSTRVYAQRIEQNHLLVEADGVITWQGDLVLKFQGFDGHISAREGTADFSTSAQTTGTGFGPREDTWAVVTIHNGTMRLVPTRAVTFAVDNLHANNATLTLESGTLPTHEPADIVLSASDADGATTIDVLPASTRTAALVSTNAARMSWLPVGASLLALGVITTALYRRSNRRISMKVDDVVRLAEASAEAGDFEAALRTVREARRLAPNSARLATDEGTYLEQLGDVTAALAAYEHAAKLSTDGEPEYLAAHLAAAVADLDEAERYLLAALAKSPAIVLELDESQAELARRPRVRQAMERARDKLGGT